MLEKIREAWSREEVRSISRRYFISNGFDGTLTAVGVAVGSFLSGVENGLTIFKIGVGAGIGLATSGVWSVWEIEKAEKLAQLHRLEKSMIRELENTEVHRKKKQGRIINATASGLGPVIGVLVTMIPFLFEPLFLTVYQATLLSVFLAVFLLAGFGTYMARISEQKAIKAAARMGLAGLVVAVLNILLPG